MFSSIRERFITFADDQRRERLDQCVEIQLALNECLRVAARKERKEQQQQQEKQQKKQSNNNKNRWNQFSRSNDNNNKQIDSGDNNDHGTYEPKMKLEDTKSGMKISRFYGWGLVNPRAQAAIAEMREQSNEWQSMGQPTSNSKVVNEISISSGEDATKTGMNDMKFSTTSSIETNNKNSRTSHSVHCTRETHALYACKALALGCGSDLMNMKNCFVEQLGTTNPSSIHYESKDGGESSSTKCHLEQRKVGDCIRKNMKELNERIEKRSS